MANRHAWAKTPTQMTNETELHAVALGLVTFGIYSWCEARWRKIQPG